ncbi:MAG: cob(I)yrinic acid a,c-diamide adenosyltransferase [Methanomassiliicoccales archaeon]
MPRIYTRTGDDGTTGLVTGKRVRKDDLIIRAIGSVDELNSAIGLARTAVTDGMLSTILKRIQSELFALGADIGSTGSEHLNLPRISKQMTERLEREIEGIGSRLPPQRSFILPGGTTGGAFLHLSRSVCRRAEREIVPLSSLPGFNKEILRYINRLGDLLHVAARYVNVNAGVEDDAPVYE